MDILSKYGLARPRPGKWYSQQLWLNAIKEISDRFLPSTLCAIGLEFAAKARVSPEIGSLESALVMMDEIYRMNNNTKGTAVAKPCRGVPNGSHGHYCYSRKNCDEAAMLCQNPNPCEFDRGFIEGIAKRFGPARGSVHIVHDDEAECRKTGAESCTYKILYRQPIKGGFHGHGD